MRRSSGRGARGVRTLRALRSCGRHEAPAAIGRALLLSASLAALVAVPNAHAQQDEEASEAASSSVVSGIDRSETFEITADRIEFKAPRDLYLAEGNVRIVRGDRRLDADWVAFSPSTKRGVASGGVIFEDGNRGLEARFLQFDTETLQGAVYDGEIEVEGEGLRVTADEFQRTGEDRYRIYDAMITTCRCPNDEREPWRLRAARSDVEFGGYGQSLNSTVEILRVPVFWIPWVLYPVKTERQSGLLFPKVGVGGRNTFEFGVPVFWAARRDLNVTWTPLWSFRRGFKNNLEIESVHGERGRTNMNFAFTNDTSVFDAGDRLTRFRDHFDDDRWALTIDHDQPIGDRFRIRALGKFVSDNQFSLDYDDLPAEDSSRWLESVLFGTARLGEDHSTTMLAGVRYADDLQAPTDRDRDRTVLQRLPEVTVRSLAAPAPLEWLSFLAPSFDAHYVHFSQRDNPREALGPPPDVPLTFVRAGASPTSGSTACRTASRSMPSGDLRSCGPWGRARSSPTRTSTTSRRRVEPRATASSISGSPSMTTAIGSCSIPASNGRFSCSGPSRWRRRSATNKRSIGAIVSASRSAASGRLATNCARECAVRSIFQGSVWFSTRSSRASVGGSFHAAAELRKGRILSMSRRRRPSSVVFALLSLDNLTRDPSDRIESTNRVTFAVANRFAKQWKPGGKTTGQLLDVVLSADWDLAGGDFGQLVLDGRTWPMGGVSTRFFVEYEPRKNRIDDALIELNARLPWDIWGRLDYRFSRRIPRFFEAYFTEEARFGRFSESVDRIHQITLATRIRSASDGRWAPSPDTASIPGWCSRTRGASSTSRSASAGPSHSTSAAIATAT